jgi:hypothetical protein
VEALTCPHCRRHRHRPARPADLWVWLGLGSLAWVTENDVRELIQKLAGSDKRH